jgi:single-stranded DNA-binding protein
MNLYFGNLMTVPTSDNQLCSVTLLGNLVNKPEIRYTVNPIIPVTEITLATHTKWLDKTTKKYKEWTSYHQIKVIGPLVEQTLLHVKKGDLVLINGYLSDNANKLNKVTSNIITASFIQTFAKGYSQSINQIHCSGTLSSVVKLLTTENNKELAQVEVTLSHHAYSIAKQKIQQNIITTKVHVWGKQAVVLSEKAQLGDHIVIEGKLNYSTSVDKSQYIEGKNIHLFKN